MLPNIPLPLLVDGGEVGIPETSLPGEDLLELLHPHRRLPPALHETPTATSHRPRSARHDNCSNPVFMRCMTAGSLVFALSEPS
jgi:hypothetical protein